MRSLAAVFALTLAACSQGPLVSTPPEVETPTGYPNHTAAEVIAEVAASVAPILSVAADGDLSVRGDGGDQSATFSLRSRLADSTTVVVRGPLGIEGGRGLVTPDSFYAADRINRQLLLGPVEAADRYVPGAGSSERVARAVVGLLVPEVDIDWSISAVDGAYRLVGRHEAGAREYTVDPGLWRVVRAREFDVDGRSAGSQTVEAFDTVDGAVLPRRVRLEGGGTTVELEHRRLVVNPPDLRLRFVRPDDYEVIRIR